VFFWSFLSEGEMAVDPGAVQDPADRIARKFMDGEQGFGSFLPNHPAGGGISTGEKYGLGRYSGAGAPGERSRFPRLP